MAIVARIIGGILLVLWLFFIRIARMHIRKHRQVMRATVFQYNILPVIVAISLLVSGNLWFLVMLPVAWVLSIPFSSFFLFFFPLPIGWVLGARVFSDIYPDSSGWYWGGGVIGVVTMEIICSIVTGIITPPAREPKPNLMKAAGKGRTEVVKALLAQGADVNAKDKDNVTALIAAAAGGHAEIVKVLLAEGADVNVKGANGWTALMVAAFDGHAAIVETLLAQGADVNSKAKEGETALMLAATEGNTEVVEALVAQGADVNAKGKGGATVLMAAVFGGRADIVEILLAQGAEVDMKDEEGVTALMAAAKKGNTEVVDLLRQAGAGPQSGSETERAMSNIDITGQLRELAELEYYGVLTEEVFRSRIRELRASMKVGELRYEKDIPPETIENLGSALILLVLGKPSIAYQEALEALPAALKIGKQLFLEEMLYLRTFLGDYATTETLGRTPLRDAVLQAYDAQFLQRLGSTEGERAKLNSRFLTYTKAVNTPHEHGPPWMVGKAFAELCGCESNIGIIMIAAHEFSTFWMDVFVYLNDLYDFHEDDDSSLDKILSALRKLDQSFQVSDNFAE